MIDIPKLYALLKNATTVEEDLFDVRFEEVVSLVDQEQLNEASTIIISILNEGKVDLRLVMYLFYTQFINKGISSLKSIFPAIKTIINDYWEKISPVNMRDKYLSSSLTWFLSTIGKKIKRSEKLYKSKKTDDFWNKSVGSLSSETIDQLIFESRELGAFLLKKTEDPSINQYVLFISKWLENLKSMVEENIDSTPDEAPLTEAPLEEPINESSIPQSPIVAVLTPSEAMIHFFQKIQAFETSIENQNFEKAALISDDIDQIIKNFDPSLFFPKLFSKYFALSATHIDTLSYQIGNKGSLKWEALHRLYRTNLEEFMEW
jgi:hypothetical protein